MHSVQAFHVMSQELIAVVWMGQNQIHLFADLGILNRVLLLELGQLFGDDLAVEVFIHQATSFSNSARER